MAQKATRVAHMTGSRADHQIAAKAHSRALEAHMTALESAPKGRKHIHEAYIDAHESAIAHHNMEGSPQPEEVEL